MAKIQYSNSSLYYATPQTNRTLGIWVPRSIPALDTDAALKINQIHQFRPDLLAYDLYGSTSLWWVFATRNKDLLKDPIYDMVADLEIMITEPGALKSILNV